MSLQLTVIAGPDTGKVFQLHGGEPFLLGRGPKAYYQLTDPAVSRTHCEVHLESDQAVVTCNGGSAGTLVNGKAIQRQALKLGDVLQVGDTQMRLQVADLPVGVAKEVMKRAGPTPAVPGNAENLEGLGKLVGTTLSHYEVGHVLGRGDNGVVFFAHDPQHGNRSVALKVLLPEFSADVPGMERFVRAMKTVTTLRHPNLVAVYGAGKTGPHCWVAMEYVAGETLTEVIGRMGVAGRIDWRHAFRIARDVGRALEYAHGEGIVHRNVTPRNILRQATDAACKLGDLMLAKAMDGTQHPTRPGELLGEVPYMAPERTRGTLIPDERSDLYGLGATLYALLTGRPPFAADTLVELIVHIRQTPPEPASKYQMSIPPLFEGVVSKLLEKKPENRYQTATEMLKDLKRVAKFTGMTD